MNCPTCATGMRAHGTDTITRPDGGLSLADLYFCGACCLWHHIAVTDPTEQITRLITITDDLLMSATQVEEQYTELLEDLRQAETGHVRVACRNCDGQFYTHHTDTSPYFCTRCESAGFRSVYLTSPRDVCWTCNTNRRDANHNCTTCRYWTVNLRDPNALIIDGRLYYIGPEPSTTDLISNPKLYGCYGTRFVIGHADGTQTTTHNLYCSGEIPIGLRPPDNAAFLGEPMHTPEWRTGFPDPQPDRSVAMTLALACLYCIDGNAPAGTDDVLGELYERCPACTPVCGDCDGLAVFPAAHHCLVCFIRVLLTRHLAPILCPGCTGLITVIDITDTEANP